MSSFKKKPVETCEVVILAGGLGSRMGGDKARMTLAGRPMLDWVRDAAAQAGFAVRLLGKDAVPRCGPLGGMVTALRSSPSRSVLFLACDMPLVGSETLTELFSASRRGRSAVFARSGDGFGFPCLLPASSLGVLEAAMQEGRYSMQALAVELKAGRLLFEGERMDELTNVNTPKDFREVELRLSRASTSSPRPVLEVAGLGIHRGGFHILKGVDWKVRQGEHWVILGPNGSGKTSLLSALTGYLTASEGEITLLGGVFGETDWRELRKRVGLVSSSIRQMIPEWEPAVETVAGGRHAMIDFWGKLSREDKSLALKMLCRFGAEELANRCWGVLSQGERQKVLISRALMANPALLILDEPCAGLDPVAREQFLGFVQSLGVAKGGPSLALVTHHVEEITPCFSHGLVLGRGCVVAQGAIGKVLRSPILSESFGAEVRVWREKGRYRLAPIKA